jgi:NAD(P)-dependent dehydrogenase (short-subunit alcohol dehydrogenase family)
MFKSHAEEEWKLTDIPDMTGKLVIITGANSGIGFQTARFLYGKGATVVAACRSVDKATTALAAIEEEFKEQKEHGEITVLQLDLGSLESVKAFPDKLSEKYADRKIDILINNAGIMNTPTYTKTPEGFELQVGTNYLGHFALTGLLFDRINTDSGRIVNLSSNMHKIACGFDFDHWNSEKGYSPVKSYAWSKAACLLFSTELNRRLQATGSNIKVASAHPGWTPTGLQNTEKESRGKIMVGLFNMVENAVSHPPENGAAPTLRAAVDPNVVSGQYYGPGGCMEMHGPPVVVKPVESATNAETAKNLWAMSVGLTKVDFLSDVLSSHSLEEWKLTDIPDMTGKFVVITGANSGIGFQTARFLYGKGATVVAACRSVDKATTALAAIEEEFKEQKEHGEITVLQLDLGSLESVKAFPDKLNAKFADRKIDILINNAGIMNTPTYTTTPEGFELQVGTNYLGHFALTGLLFDRINADSGRIINLSSNMHKVACGFDFTHWNSEKGYNPIKSYAWSKAACLLFSTELNRRLQAKGSRIKVATAHPGWTPTGLQSTEKSSSGAVMVGLFNLVENAVSHPPENGAAPTLRAAVDPRVVSGQYYGPGGFMEMNGPPVVVKPLDSATNAETAASLWALSAGLTKVDFLQ